MSVSDSQTKQMLKSYSSRFTQALLANMAAMYAVYHGPNRLSEIARTVHKSAAFLAQSE